MSEEFKGEAWRIATHQRGIELKDAGHRDQADVLFLAVISDAKAELIANMQIAIEAVKVLADGCAVLREQESSKGLN